MDNKMTAEQALERFRQDLLPDPHDERDIDASWIRRRWERYEPVIRQALSAPRVPDGWRVSISKYGLEVSGPDGKIAEARKPSGRFGDTDPVVYEFLSGFLLTASPEPVAPSDKRPANCRERLREEGKAYPRTGCLGCGSSFSNGGLKTCPYSEGSHGPVAQTIEQDKGKMVGMSVGRISNEHHYACREIVAERNDLRAEVEALRVDAERYRWLRDDDNWGCDNDEETESRWADLGELSLDEFDAYIDAARLREGGM